MAVNRDDSQIVAIVSKFPPGVLGVEIEQFGKGVQWITVSEDAFEDMMATLENWKDPDSD